MANTVRELRDGNRTTSERATRGRLWGRHTNRSATNFQGETRSRGCSLTCGGQNASDCVLHGQDSRGEAIRDVDLEPLLQRQNQIWKVERVDPQIFDESTIQPHL